MTKDLISAYKLLEIDYSIPPTFDLINQKFRSKALLYHPDTYSHDSSNEVKERAAKFQEVSDAKAILLEEPSAFLKTWSAYTSQNAKLTIEDKAYVSELQRELQERLHSYLSKTLGKQDIPNLLKAKYNEKTAMWELPTEVKLSRYSKEQRANILLWLVTYSEAQMLNPKFSVNSTNFIPDIPEEFLISILQNRAAGLKQVFNLIAIAVNTFNVKMISSSLFGWYTQYCVAGSSILLIILDSAALIPYFSAAGILILGFSLIPTIFNFINQRRVAQKYESKDPVFIASRLQDNFVGKLLTLVAYSATTIAAIVSIVLFGPIAGIIYLPLIPLIFSNILTCIVAVAMTTQCNSQFNTENIDITALCYKRRIIKKLDDIMKQSFSVETKLDSAMPPPSSESVKEIVRAARQVHIPESSLEYAMILRSGNAP